MNIENLVEAINENPSDYEDRYIRWVSIGYDKKSLVSLLYELKFLKETDPENGRAKFLESILNEYDLDTLYKLLTNDLEATRFAVIEKWARIAAMEILIHDKYSIETLNVITQLPIADYQLIVKRTQELVNIISDITTQATSMTSGIAGV